MCAKLKDTRTPSSIDFDYIKARQRFDQLADSWERDTSYYSSVELLRNHRAFSEIKKLGSRAIPWVIERLNRDEYWFVLLEEMADFRPDAEPGDIELIVKEWKEWGESFKKSHVFR